jgi:polyhydroxyalkanoate synthesis regulator phasin
MVIEAVRKMMLAGFGAQEKFRELVDDLVKRGELSESQGAKVVREWSDKAGEGTAEIGRTLGDMVTGVLEKMHLPTRDDIARMEREVQELKARVISLEEKG